MNDLSAQVVAPAFIFSRGPSSRNNIPTHYPPNRNNPRLPASLYENSAALTFQARLERDHIRLFVNNNVNFQQYELRLPAYKDYVEKQMKINLQRSDYQKSKLKIAATTRALGRIQDMFHPITYKVLGAVYTDYDLDINDPVFDKGYELANSISDLLQKNRSPSFRKVRSFLDLAIAIYRSLYVNLPGQRAYFYLSFQKINKNMSPQHFTGRERFGEDKSTTKYYAVRMSTDTNGALTEILYIMDRLIKTLIYREEIYESGKTEPNKIDKLNLKKVFIRQILSHDNSTFSRAIRKGPKHNNIERFIGAFSNSADPALKRTFTVIQKVLRKEKFYLSSPGSYKNCVVKSILIGKKNKAWEILTPVDRIKLNKAASTLITKLFPNKQNKDHTLKEYLEALKEHSDVWNNHSQYNIVFVNYLLEEIGSVGKMNIDHKTIVVMIFGGHAVAVLHGKKPTKEEEWVEIEKPPIKKEDYRNWVTYDIETTSDTVVPYAIGLYDGERYKSFVGLDCIDRFLEHVITYYNGINLFAHNGGKFDTVLLVEAIKRNKHLEISSILDLHGRILKLAVFDKSNKRRSNSGGQLNKYAFLDSYPLLGTSLKQACLDYGVEQKGDINHDIVTEKNFLKEWERQEIDGYLRIDCASLYDILLKFEEANKRMFKMEILGKCLTAPAISRKMFMNEYYDPLSAPLYHLPEKVDKWIRRGYYGGRSQTFYRGEFSGSDWKYLDIVSLYPSVMREVLPYGKGEWREINSNKLPYGFYGFVEAKISGGRTRGINPLRFKSEKHGLIDPYFKTPMIGVFFSETLRFAEDEYFKYDIQYLKGYNFQRSKWLEAPMMKLYNMKNEAKANYGKGSPYYMAIKQRLNSLYGFFALKYRDKRLTILNNGFDAATYFASGNLHAIRGEIAYVTEKTETSVRYVPAAAAIAALAELKMLKLLVGIEKAGFKTIYMDTDSVITNAPDSIVNEYIKIGSNLGELEHECAPGFSVVTIAPKIYAIKGSFVKCKGFPKGGYEKKVKKAGHIIFSGRGKGDYKLTYEDIKFLLRRRRSLQVSFTTFRCGRMGWLEEEVKLNKVITTINITGKIYKGVEVDEGDYKEIAPLTYENGVILKVHPVSVG